MNEHFSGGFEKQAAKFNLNLKPAKDLAKGIKNNGAEKLQSLGERTREFLLKQKPKTMLGMTLVGAPALIYGGYKGVDSVIGTPNKDGTDW